MFVTWPWFMPLLFTVAGISTAYAMQKRSAGGYAKERVSKLLIMFGAQMNNAHRFYLPDERYAEIKKQFPDGGLTLLSARLDDGGDAMFFQADYNKAVSTDGLIFDFIYDNAKQARTMVPMIAGIVVTAFAAILLAVSMIVIRFRIVNSIEEGMTNIGAQKAVGYRNAQIVSSVVIQFACIAVVGGVAGTALAQAVIPAVMKILEPVTGLVWNPGFDMGTAAIALCSVLLTVSLISFLSARRINKLHPLIALRGGITTHSFKKNALPLDTARGNFNFLLALK